MAAGPEGGREDAIKRNLDLSPVFVFDVDADDVVKARTRPRFVAGAAWGSNRGNTVHISLHKDKTLKELISVLIARRPREMKT
jgi:hypothetical protein